MSPWPFSVRRITIWRRWTEESPLFCLPLLSLSHTHSLSLSLSSVAESNRRKSMTASLRKLQAAALGHRIVWLKASVLQFIIVPSLIAIPNFAEAVTHPQDVEALIALHSAWLGNPSSWDTSTDPCDDQWLGIWCNQTRVTRMLLINQDLAGTLSPAVGNLTYLTDLDLSCNHNLGGTLPAEIGNLTRIVGFFVQFCNFSGPIPSEIGSMTSVLFLGLSQNSFTGLLPATIGFLKKMIFFDVASNHLNGYLPVSTTSGIGSGLDNLTSAQHFHFQNNMFSGSIPSSICNTEMQLVHLLLNGNEFSGIIPSNIGNLLHVEILSLDSNFLTGTVPSTISAIPNLTTLHLNNNNLTGQLPDLSNMTKLQMLTVGNNPFEASEIPSWITNMANLQLLSMDSSNLIGNIPAEIFGFSQHLSNVTFGSNQLNGTLDLTLANSSVLLLVNLTNNVITNLDKGNYTQELLLDGNPYCDRNPIQCQSSSPPAASPSTTIASQCTNECPSEYAINPKDPGNCQCSRPVVATYIFYATKIIISLNYSTREMEQLFLTGLRTNIFLEGFTWHDTQAVVDIVSSDRVNLLCFPPNSTSQWSSCEAAIISYVLQNHNIGFPAVGCFVSDVTGGRYLSVVVVNKLSTGAKIGIGIASALGFAILVIGFYAMMLKRRAVKAEKLNKPFSAWIATRQEETANIPQLKGARWFSFEEIRKCTNNFSHSNEIGEGGYGKVYNGVLLSGEQVAIKRAGSSSSQGAAEFKNEIELLSRVHHRNLVGLIGFCFEEDEQMLVYEYMPNGTLRECLSAGQTELMDWKQRIWLALDSARGIAYLHTEANPPIIHGDIKSSNILLDEKMVAKVADFGFSKVVRDGDGNATMTTEVRGTMGYLDPDYYMTNMLTYKSDVYSFGVVLLEMVTGRLPIQGGRHLVHEVTTSFGKGGMDLVVQNMVDPDLRDSPLKTVERLVEVALNCVQHDPAERLTMAEVVKELGALVGEGPSAFTAVNIDMGEEHKLYKLPFMQESCGSSSFELSGSYVGISRTVEPQ